MVIFKASYWQKRNSRRYLYLKIICKDASFQSKYIVLIFDALSTTKSLFGEVTDIHQEGRNIKINIEENFWFTSTKTGNKYWRFWKYIHFSSRIDDNSYLPIWRGSKDAHKEYKIHHVSIATKRWENPKLARRTSQNQSHSSKKLLS